MNVKTMQVVMMSLLLAAVPVLASAQAREASWENLQQIPVGQRIEVVEKDMKKHTGTFTSYSEESIALRIGQDEVGIRRENVLRVSNREKTHRRRNALKGALIGAGAGGLTGLAVTAFFCLIDEPGITAHCMSTGFPVVVLIGAVGAGGGAAVGVAFPSYQTIYRAPK